MDLSILLSSGGTAVIMAYALQGLKKASWFPWLTIETSKLNLAFSILMAAAANIGIHWTWQQSSGSLTITGLTLGNLAHFVGHTAGQWVAQHISYKAFVTPSELQAISINVLKQILVAQQKGPTS